MVVSYKNDRLVQIGLVLGLHGKRGKLKAYRWIDFDLFKSVLMSELAVFPSGQKFICSSVVPTGKADVVIIGLPCSGNTQESDPTGVASMVLLLDTGQDGWRDMPIMCHRKSLGKEVLARDLVGLQVYYRSGFLGLKKVLYGQVVSVHNFGAGDLVEILKQNASDKAGLGQCKQSGQTAGHSLDTEMYPFLRKIFPKISLPKGEVIISLKAAGSRAHVAF